jgi:hypothetical protein
MEDYREKIFEDTFNNVCTDMRRRRQTDSQFTKEYLEGVLQSLYVDQGNDWVGRGEVRDIINDATISACELILSEW